MAVCWWVALLLLLLPLLSVSDASRSAGTVRDGDLFVSVAARTALIRTLTRAVANQLGSPTAGGDPSLGRLLFFDPTDPWVFCDKNVNDPRIRALSKTTTLEPMPSSTSQVSMATRVTLHLKTGSTVSAEGDNFKGTPTMPLTRGELLEKFLKLTAHRSRPNAERLFSQLSDAENVKDMSALNFAL